MSTKAKVDTKKVETKKTEAPKTAPKVEKKAEPKKEAPKKEAPKKESAPKTEAKKEAPKAETKKVEAKKEAPKKVETKKVEKKEVAPKEVKEVKKVEKVEEKKEVLKPKRKGEKIEKKVIKKFHIDCSIPVKDGIFDLDDYHKFLTERWKVDNKVKNFGGKVSIVKEHENVKFTFETDSTKKYVKYLTKKYLKKHDLRDWLHCVATSSVGYQLKYFPITQEEDEKKEDKMEETK
jgi:large subunit ribosomal protein L22e